MPPLVFGLLLPTCYHPSNSYTANLSRKTFIPFLNCLKKGKKSLSPSVSLKPIPAQIPTKSLALQLLEKSSRTCFPSKKEGGQGEVEFFQDTIGTSVALKVLKDSQVDRFAREVLFTRLAGSCRHSVHYREARVSLDGKFELVTDLAGQKDLFEILSTKPANQGLMLEDVLEIAKQVLEFLEEFHKKGAIHGDLRLENIVWNFTDEVSRVIDFGMSRKFQEKQLNWAPPYIGPELVFQMKTTPDQDFWNLGLIIYTLVVHKQLFPKKMTPLAFEKILQREFGKLPQSMIKKMDPNIRSQVFKLEDSKYISKNGNVPYDPKWEQTIRRKLKYYSDNDVESFLNFLKSLFDYRNPKTAKELLQHPLMNIDISFQIGVDESLLTNGLKLVIHGANDYRKELSISKELNGSCIHVRPSNIYQMQIYNKTQCLFDQCYSIVQGSRVNIRI